MDVAEISFYCMSGSSKRSFRIRNSMITLKRLGLFSNMNPKLIRVLHPDGSLIKIPIDISESFELIPIEGSPYQIIQVEASSRKGEKDWTRVGLIQDLFPHRSDKVFRTELHARDVMIVKQGNDEFYCIDSVCYHMAGPLNLGDIEDFHVVCPWHRFRFDIRTGKRIMPNGVESEMVKQRVHNLKVTDEAIHVKLQLENPAACDSDEYAMLGLCHQKQSRSKPK